jgi:hypothetical protein
MVPKRSSLICVKVSPVGVNNETIELFLAQGFFGKKWPSHKFFYLGPLIKAN